MEKENLNYVYILRSLKYPKQVYVGITSDLQRRLLEHNEGYSQHTRKFKPWCLEVAFWFDDAQKAILFERYLKSGSGRAFRSKHF